jgi:DNA-binding MarR family transcriptional regulator
MSAQGSAASGPRETSVSKARLRAWLQLLKLTRAVESDLRERMRREFGWTLPRFDVMAALYRSEAGMRMSELAGALVVSNGNVTALVDGLAADRLVVRVADAEDRRASIVRLTQKGRESFGALAAVHEGWIDAALGGLDRGEIEALAALLQKARKSRDARR